MAVLKVNSFSSRDTNIESGTLRANNNTSVDVLLNSIAGESLQASWRCIAPLVRFVEISKADSVQNSYLEVKRFLGSETFAGVDLTVVAKYEPDISIKLLTDVLELYRTSAIEAVSPITSFAMSELQIAMRLMQGGKHMGKIIIRSHGDEVVQVMFESLFAGWIHTETCHIGTTTSHLHNNRACRCVVPYYGRHRRNRTVTGILACQERCQTHRARLAQWF